MFQTNTGSSFLNGFSITFENGVTVSVQFGPHNYSNGSTTAETAVIDASGQFLPHQGDDVQGHQSPADVLATFNMAAALPRKA